MRVFKHVCVHVIMTGICVWVRVMFEYWHSSSMIRRMLRDKI